MHGQSITSSLLIFLLSVLYYNITSLTGLKISLLLCLLISILHGRITCEHNNKLNMWVADNIAPLDILFIYYSLYNKLNKSKNHTSTFVYHLLFVKLEFYFHLEKTGLAKTGVAGLILPSLLSKRYSTVQRDIPQFISEIYVYEMWL